MKALVIERPHEAVIKDVPYPQPKHGEITIRVERAGICGTDIHIYQGEYVSPYPLIPGHEFSGVVDAVGEGVEDWEIGDRVSADPNIPCGACRFCLTQRANQCSRWEAIGVTLNGAMAEYVSIPARLAVKLPDSMDFAAGAFIEPMACVVHSLNRLQLRAGDRVLLFGAGAMGQQLVQALSRAGASELVVVDLSQSKLDLALQWGATRAIDGRQVQFELGPLYFPYGFDIVIDSTGVPAVIEQAFDYMGPTAKYLQFGVTPRGKMITVDPFKLFHNDWTILGSMAINYSFIPAYQWVREKRIDTTPLLSKTISLEEAIEFFAGPRDPELLKVHVKP